MSFTPSKNIARIIRENKRRAAELAKQSPEVQAEAEAARVALFAKREAKHAEFMAKLRRDEEQRDKDNAPVYARARAMLAVIGDDCAAITCGNCGKPAGVSKWFTDALGFPRPTNELQCPNCGCAIRRECKAGYIQLTPIQATL